MKNNKGRLPSGQSGKKAEVVFSDENKVYITPL
jgi:hypothetical protein